MAFRSSTLVWIALLPVLVTTALCWQLYRRSLKPSYPKFIELDYLCDAVTLYKDKFGEHPLSFGADWDENSRADLSHFLAKVFPHFPDPTYSHFSSDVAKATQLDVNDLDAAEALPFWLGGIPSKASGFKLTGFAANPQSPFSNKDDSPIRMPPFFSFDSARLTDTDNDGWPEYQEPQSMPIASGRFRPPYVYFSAIQYRSSYYPRIACALPEAQAAFGTCVPYHSDGETWMAEHTFQLILAGNDGCYGSRSHTLLRRYPSMNGCTEADFDNYASFCSTLVGDARFKSD